jgi:two-component system sensor histidine kinase UhpB
VDGAGGRRSGVDVLTGRMLSDGPLVVFRGVLDDPGTWEFSPNAERVLGWLPADVASGLDGWLERMHPDDRGPTADGLASVHAGQAEAINVQFRLRQRDGGYRWFWMLVQAEHDEVAGRRYLVAYDLDITERVVVEEAVRRQNQDLERSIRDRTAELETANAWLRSVIEGIADPVYVKDRSGRYLLTNPAMEQTTGLPAGEMIGRTDAEFLPAPAAAEFRAADRRVMALGRPERFREELDTEDGPRVYQAVKAPWRDGTGRVAGVVGVSRDVTEEERIHTELRRLLGRLHQIQEEERGRIAVGLHDGPVQGLAMLGYKLARARALLAEGRVEPATTLLGECEADVTGEVAALRRTIHDLRPLVLDQQGLAAALRDQADAVRARAGLASCRVTARLDGAAGGFETGPQAPRGRLGPAVEIALFRVAQQALANIADHAMATAVEVRLERSPTGEIVLLVTDDGCGFERSHVERAGGGLGFGLTAMRERVEALGGQLSVQTRPGGGTSVKARVPYPPAPQAEARS